MHYLVGNVPVSPYPIKGVPEQIVENVPVSHELDKCVPPQVFTYPLSF